MRTPQALQTALANQIPATIGQLLKDRWLSFADPTPGLRPGRPTYPEEKSVQTGGTTPVCLDAIEACETTFGVGPEALNAVDVDLSVGEGAAPWGRLRESVEFYAKELAICIRL
jgi:hypothetical protein